MNPWLILVVVALWGGSVAGTYRYAEKVGENRIIAQQKRVDDIVQKTRDAAIAGAAKAIAAAKPKAEANRQEIEREVQTEVRYVDCRHSDEQLRRINRALTGGFDPEPAGSGIVPRVDALGGPIVRGNDAQARISGNTVP